MRIGYCRGRTLRLIVLAALLTGSTGLADEGADEGSEGRPFSGVAPSDLADADLDHLLAIQHTETEQVRLVLLPTSVTNKRGRVVRGLDEGDFRVFEDQIPQEIGFFAAEATEPISLAFLLDVSGSMRQTHKLDHAKEAIRFFVDQLNTQDQFGLICFADEQVDWVTNFTRDRSRFLQRLEVQRGWGQTAIHDAVAAAPGLVDQKIRGRRALVLITDGADNLSQLTLERALDIAARVDVPIYTIGFLPAPEEHFPKDSSRVDLELLARVSEETGGRLFPVYDVADLKEAITDLNNELRYQYLIGYYPTRGSLDGAYRQVEMQTVKDRHQVRTRTGYYAD